MGRRDLRVAGIAVGVGLLIIVMVAVIGLIQGANMVTRGGGGPHDGNAFAIPTAARLMPDANGAFECPSALFIGRVVSHPEWGIAVQREQGGPLLAFWPHG
jgi:hypothetical protein